jgi:putative transposase
MPNRYSTDLTNEQWDLIRRFLPTGREGRGRPMELEVREVVDAILYVLRTGCQWANLPNDYPNANSVYYHYRKWCLDGTWRRVNRALRRQEREERDRESEPTGAILDSQSIETTEAGGPRGYDAGKGVWGRKRHVITDTVGNVLDVVVHAADIQDRDGARLLLNRLWEQTQKQIEKIWADGAYAGQLIDWVQENLDALLEIVEREEEQDGFEVLPRRWVVERTFAWLGRYRRLSKDYERTIRSSEGMIYLASIHTMTKRLAPDG